MYKIGFKLLVQGVRVGAGVLNNGAQTCCEVGCGSVLLPSSVRPHHPTVSLPPLQVGPQLIARRGAAECDEQVRMEILRGRSGWVVFDNSRANELQGRGIRHHEVDGCLHGGPPPLPSGAGMPGQLVAPIQYMHVSCC